MRRVTITHVLLLVVALAAVCARATIERLPRPAGVDLPVTYTRIAR